MKWTTTEIAEAIASLKEDLKPGDTVYTQVKSVARSGMSRTISCYVIKNNEPRWISRLVAKATNSGYDDNKEAVKVAGCGSDMGFELVYYLSRVLFPDGFGIECESCGYRMPSKDAILPDECYGKSMMLPAKTHVFWGRNRSREPWDNDGGYALKQRWL